MRPAELGSRTRPVLLAAIGLQWLSTLIAVHVADHDGWRFAQSGRAVDSVQGAFRLADGDLPREGPGILWPTLLSPIASVAGSFEGVLSAVVPLNVLVLGPVALVAAYWVAAKIGGHLLAVWSLAVWLISPWALLVMAQGPYVEVVRDRVLPLVLGLTAEPAYPAAVALITSGALVAWSLGREPLRVSALAGLVAGAAVAIEPSNLLFAVPAVIAYLLARRFLEASAFALALAPALLAVAVWRSRGLGELGALSFGTTSPHEFRAHMGGLREYFWSQRLLQWLPLAGTLAVARRSLPLAVLLGGWTLAFVFVEGSLQRASFEAGAYVRVLLPALPAYVLLVAAIPLLVPTLGTRLSTSLRPLASPSRLGLRAFGVAALVLAACPLAAAVLASS